VTATRAEGFGLPIFEAAIMGKTIIAPRWGGQHEFLEGYPNYKDVWHFLTPAFAGEDDVKIVGNQMQIATTMARGIDCKQMWADPSLDRLSFLMRMVRDDFREGLVRDNHHRRSWFEKNYSLEAIGLRLHNTLKEICS
jgi:glycosyltransferase involved in cell wall biosynthesis